MMASRKPRDSKVSEELQYANATPLQVLRSDGTEMPSEYSQYEKVEEGAKAIIEWQNKLGQAMAAELMPGVPGLFYLQGFPAHYHLRWYQAKEDKKNQARHYYLFGYPEDTGASKARKYYRSPNHFLPHLIWLIGDSQDKGDCSCEFCSGLKPINNKGKGKVTTFTQQPMPSSVATGTAPAPPTSPATSAATSSNVAGVVAPANRTTTNVFPNTATRPASYPEPAAQQFIPIDNHQVMAYQMPETATAVPMQHSYLARDHDFLFKAGEVVWYKNNNSWRVGMILVSGAIFSIIPFSHPLYPTQEVYKGVADIRPFLAFSIPQINSALQELRGRALAQIDWKSLQERFGTLADPSRQEGLAIEATKLAATRVDQCYSTFHLIQADQIYSVYAGVFLGAEKICIGEAVRIHLSREQRDQVAEKGMPVVMVIQRIIIMGQEDAGGHLMFEGSLWKLQHVPLAQQQQMHFQAQLPAAMLGEKRFRDNMLKLRGWCVEWVPMNQNLSVNEPAIRGRFYETQRLMSILNPAKFQEMMRLQVFDDIQTLLNNRADSDGPRVGRVRNRAQAVIGAVPNNVLGALNLDVMEG